MCDRTIALICKELVATRLREHPTLPPSASPEVADAGEAWPWAFCAFQGCEWEDRRGNETALEQHLGAAHMVELRPICDHMLFPSVFTTRPSQSSVGSELPLPVHPSTAL